MKKMILFTLLYVGVLLLTSITLMSCNTNTDDVKAAQNEYTNLCNAHIPAFNVGVQTYELVTASDSCQYYYMRIAKSGTDDIQYFHYPQCSFCKTHK